MGLKQADIQAGARYVGKGGRVREVVGFVSGDHWHRGRNQGKRVFVDYWTIEEGRGHTQLRACTLQSFARWAERREDG